MTTILATIALATLIATVQMCCTDAAFRRKALAAAKWTGLGLVLMAMSCVSPFMAMMLTDDLVELGMNKDEDEA